MEKLWKGEYNQYSSKPQTFRKWFNNGAKYTAQALDDMIKGLKGKGYEIVPISKLIYKKNYQMDHEGRQFVVGVEGKVTQ